MQLRQNTKKPVDKNSNHPPLVLQNIPKGINSRLSRISSNKRVFDAAKTEYQEALSRSGYDFQLYYNPETKTKNGKRNRRRKVTPHTLLTSRLMWGRNS